MPNAEITKKALGQAMKELMQHTAFDKISVSDITKKCGMNRNTFYYHFQDKYELVNWIFCSETSEYIYTVKYDDNWTDGILKICMYMVENKKFYSNALNHMGQNSLTEYLLHFIKETILEFIKAIPKAKTITDSEIDFIANFYASAFVGLVMYWAKGGLKEDPTTHVKHIEDLIRKGLISALA